MADPSSSSIAAPSSVPADDAAVTRRLQRVLDALDSIESSSSSTSDRQAVLTRALAKLEQVLSERSRPESTEADLDALVLIQRLSVRLIEGGSMEALLQDIMETAVSVTGAERGTLQLIEEDSLRIVAAHGHEQPFLEFFASAETRASACGRALSSGERVIVPDIDTSDLFVGTPSLDVLRAAGVRAVQSTPMISRRGRLLGVLTTQWSVPHAPDDHDLWRIDLLARQAADLIDIKRANDELRDMSTRFQAILDHAPVAIYVKNVEGRFVLGNHRLERFTARPVEAMIGTTDYDWFPAEAADRFRENDLKVLRSGRVWEFEETGTDANGQPYVNLSVKFPVTDESGTPIGVCGISTDITVRKRAEEALRDNEERLRIALDSARMGTFDFRPITGELVWGERMKQMWGIGPADQLVYAEALARVHPDDRERFDRNVRASLGPDADGDFEQEYRIVWPDGSVHWSLGKGRVYFEGEGSERHGVRMIGIQIDITEMKRAEEALRDANTRLLEADRRKNEFIAILSHELRNPLAPIRYALPLIQSQPLDESASRAEAVIARQVNHLTRLVDDLLDVGRITSDKIELRRERVTLRSVVTAAIEAAMPALTAVSRTLKVAVDDEPIWLDADAARLSQVVTNLLDNSAKYTPSGGHISVRAGLEDGRAVIRVRDTGIGIPCDALTTVFDMFRQVKRPDWSQGGLGIGLAVAKRLVEMHDGTIEARSDGPGQGSEFIVRLPIAAGSAREQRAGSPATAPARGRALKVLVVDDNDDLVQMLAMTVEGAGHDARTALNGPSAISIASSYCPDLVLLDLGLPGMSGLEVARVMRRMPETSSAMIVALTGWGQLDDRRETRDAGFDAHLTKPTDPEQLAKLFEQFARERE